MRRMILTAAAILLLLCGCTAQTEPDETSVPAPEGYVTTQQAAQAVVDSQADLAGLPQLEQEDRDFYLTELYGLEEGAWTEAAIFAASGVDAREVAVIRLSNEGDWETVNASLWEYCRSRLADFVGYAPEQAALVEGCNVISVDGYMALMICQDSEDAEQVLLECLLGESAKNLIPETVPPTEAPTPTPAVEPDETPPEPTQTPEPAETAAPTQTPPPAGAPSPTPAAEPDPTPAPTPAPTPTPVPTAQVLNPGLDISGFTPFNPPNEYDMSLYNTSAIQAAYASGSTGGLSEKDAAILARCREALEACVTPDMTAFEKELALHDWLLDNCTYDESVHNVYTPQGQPDNTNPYGPLVQGYGICLGYATSFQLLMDLSGVECITVVGASSDSTGDHAWNMVRLEGEWYCVDPTWDDPIGVEYVLGETRRSQLHHRYFNVTSEYMRQSNHQWDYLNVPEATATRFLWTGKGTLPS